MLANLFLLYIWSSTVSSQECLAVSIQGGGSRGSYEAGVLYALANSTKAGSIKYTSVSGVSIGSITAGILSQYPIGQELEMSLFAIDFWLSLNGSSSIYIDWPGGVLEGLLFRPGIYDDSPAIKLANSLITKPLTRNLTIGSSNLDTGMYYVFNNSVEPAVADAIISSSSIPFFFPPHLFEGYSWIDGGVIINQNVFSAINTCLEYTDESNITVDLLFDIPINPLPVETEFKTLDVFSRTYEIKQYDNKVWELYTAIRAYPDVYFRYAIIPSANLEPALNFTKSAIEFDIALGISDTLKILEQQPSVRETATGMYVGMKSIIYP
jgi:predicted acylesterase/phospholipase RssA